MFNPWVNGIITSGEAPRNYIVIVLIDRIREAGAPKEYCHVRQSTAAKELDEMS